MIFEPEETWHTQTPSPEARQKMDRRTRMNRTITPPAGMRSAAEVRRYFLDQAKAFEESAEGPMEIQAAKDYHTLIESTTDEKLLDQYAKATKHLT